jgi:diaminopimelate epimerase
MLVHLTKCHGSGNDFVLLDEYSSPIESNSVRVSLAQVLCDRQQAIGADGLLFVGPSKLADFSMRMFNPDGSEAETCLNGLRCAGRYAIEKLGRSMLSAELLKGLAAVSLVDDLTSGVVTIQIEVKDSSLRLVDLPLFLPTDTLIDGFIPGLDDAMRFTAVAMPNPHLVSFVDKIDDEHLVRLGERIEQGIDILPNRANVTFAVSLSNNTLFSRTFERGVGLTPSCGSAMAATTLAAFLQGIIGPAETKIYNHGGFVFVTANKGQSSFILTMRGNATYIYKAVAEVDLKTRSLITCEIANVSDGELTAYQIIAKEAIAVAETCCIASLPRNL